MATYLSLLGGAGWQFFDNNGNILSGGKLYVYNAGTTTLATTYTSSTGVTPNANPLILDSAGRPAEEIWYGNTNSLKFVLKTALGVDVWTKDNIPATASAADIAAFAGPNGSALIGFTQGSTGASTRTVQSKLRDFVNIADFGGVADGVTDNQQAIQNAVNHCATNGIGTIYFGSGTYAYRTTTRTSPTTDVHAYDGMPIIIPIGAHITFRGSGQGTTILKQLSVNGNSPNTDWQLVGGNVWRGPGIYVKGSVGAPSTPTGGAGITLMDLTLDGGVAYSNSNTAGAGGATYPANPATGGGWDLTQKAIWCENDRYTDHIRVIRSRLTGWGGECTYQGGQFHRELTVLDCQIDTCNGDGINPCCQYVNVDGVLMYNVFQCMEGWTGRAGGQVINFRAYNCYNAGVIQGGTAGAGTYSTYYAPTRYSDGLIPLGTIDLEFVNCRGYYVGSFLQGNVTVVDAINGVGVSIGGASVFEDGVRDIYLNEVTVVADTISVATGVNFYPGNPAGTELSSNINIKTVRAVRTLEARLASRSIAYPFRWSGSIGPQVVIENLIAEATSPAQSSGASAIASAYYPIIKNYVNAQAISGPGNAFHNVETTATIPPFCPIIQLSNTNPGTFTGTLDNTRVQSGQEVELYNGSGNGYFVISTTNTRLKYSLALVPGQRAKFAWDGGAWQLVTAPVPITATTVIDVPAIAAGGVSAEQTITLNGATTDMPVTVIAPVAIAANAAVQGAYVSATNTVKFRLRDLTGAGYDPPSGSYTAVNQVG